MRLHSAGIDLSAVIELFVGTLAYGRRNSLARPSRLRPPALSRALISYMATQDLSISGSEVARRLNIDRSAVSRAVQRAGKRC